MLARACAVLLLGASPLAAVAQGRGGGGPGGGGRPGGMGRGEFGPNASTFSTPPPGPRPAGKTPFESTMSGGMQLGPPGRWWDNGKFAESIGINSMQQKRMDGIFGDNKGTLVKLYKSLQHEQTQLEKATRAKDLDENTIFQQIDRVASARGELEKAFAHMQLQIRKEMTPEQASKLDDHRPAQ